MSPDVAGSYDTLAETYTERFFAELDHKPFDRKMLDRLAERVVGTRPVCDLGCGPGQAAHYLVGRGVPSVGIDLSPRMVGIARERTPGATFEVGDMRDLRDVADGAFGGIVGLYSIVNLTPGDLPAAFAEMNRIVAPGGPLLLAFHVGDETRHLESLWEHAVSLDFGFFESAAVTALLGEAGWVVEEVVERMPYPPEVEVQTRRAYLFARRPIG